MRLLYTKMKIFHFKDKVDSLPKDNKRILPPLHIRIKPTNVCNHGCRYCAYRQNNLQLGRDMSERDYLPKNKMLEIMEDIINMGVKAVTFSGGGEPFCYPYLLDAVRKLAKSRVKFACLTNGSLLKGEIAEIFSRRGTWVRISIDGWDEESYSSYRKVQRGEFSKVMKNMRDFKKMAGKCHLGVSLIVDRINASHIDTFLKRLKDTGVDSAKLSPCIVSNEAKKNNQYHAKIFTTVKNEIARAKKQLEDSAFEIFDAYHELDEKFKKDYTWCPYLQILPVIGADSNVYSCQDKAYNLKYGLLGSIKNRRFKNFWFSDKNKFFRINPANSCNHHCVANEKNRIIWEYLNTSPKHLCFV